MHPPPIDSEERFRLLVESVTDYAIFMLDPGGHVATWNLGAERIKGYKADEIIGKHFSIFYPPEDDRGGQDPARARDCDPRGPLRGGGLARPQGRLALLGQRHHHRATQSRRHAGRLREGHARPHRAPTRPRKRRERFRLLVESVKDYAIFMLDPAGTSRPGTRAPSASRATRPTRSSASTSRSSIHRRTSRRARPSDELEIATREGRFEEEGWRVRKDGSRIWANVIITALRNPRRRAGRVREGHARSHRAPSKPRRIDARWRPKAALAEKARIQEFQERFIAILGHDLRNPLASIDYGSGTPAAAREPIPRPGEPSTGCARALCGCRE